jgi:hypothetical protein
MSLSPTLGASPGRVFSFQPAWNVLGCLLPRKWNVHYHGRGRVRDLRRKRDVQYVTAAKRSRAFVVVLPFGGASSVALRGRACGCNAAAERTGAPPVFASWDLGER